MELCISCGLPVLAGRAGSMTQWIFRASSCKCDSKLLRPSVDSIVSREPVDDSSSSQADARKSIDSEDENFYISDEVSPLTIELGLPSDRYQAIKLVGKGAVSKVYKCQDRLLRRVVAIKFLINTRWSRRDLLQFQTEAKATSKLAHPNIITVHDFGSTTNGQPYMVLEFFTGISLDDLVRTRGPLPEDVAAEIGAQIAEGMNYAHSKGVLHRDIKPANIMLIETTEGVVAKIIDFGIAELNAAEDPAFEGSSVVGTPSYMSPDELNGRKSDARSDIYSLGCTLFYAMTGNPPFTGTSSVEVVNKHVHESPPTLRETLDDAEFSDDIESIIAKSLNKNPADRFQSMEKMRSALNGVHRGATQHGNVDSSGVGRSNENENFATSDHSDTAGDITPKGARSIPLLVLTISALASGALLIVPKLIDTPSTNTLTAAAPEPKTAAEKRNELRWQSPFGIDIQENFPDNEILKKYENRRNVEDISIRGANINDDGLKYIMNCGVVGLGLEASKITNKGFRKVCTIKTLKRLNLSHSPQLTDYSCLKLCPQLTSAWFLANELTDKQLEDFSHLEKLNSTNLSGNPQITGSGFVHLQNLKDLRDMRLNSLQFTTDGIKSLASLKQVEWLQLRYSNVTDDDLDAIATMKNLRSLSLIRTDITDTGIMKLAKLPQLKQLYVGICKRVTPAGIAQLNQRRPDIVINTKEAYAL